MTHRHAPALAAALLAACASAPRPPAATAPPRVASRAPSPPAVAPPPAPPPQRPAEPLEVRGRAPEPLEFNITANSDLPPSTSTAQPYERTVEAAVAPLRPALAECLRSLGAPARRAVRVTIEPDGAVLPRPPQEYALNARDASCVDGVLRATTVDPPPPRALPYDIRVEVSR